jgi:phosphoenolpyruvate carboxykinase (ATP)
MYHFISGYTSKMAGTEQGVTEPEATFSACFGQPFLVLHPTHYAEMLSEKISHHKANAWLVNTGWVGRSVAKGGQRCPLKYTRAILNAIHDGSLAKAKYENFDVFNLNVPTACAGVPDEILNPARAWQGSAEEFKSEIRNLATLFSRNFDKYKDQASKDVIV